MTIAINTKKDKGILIYLLVSYPYIRSYILDCYDTNAMNDLLDYVIGVD